MHATKKICHRFGVVSLASEHVPAKQHAVWSNLKVLALSFRSDFL